MATKKASKGTKPGKKLAESSRKGTGTSNVGGGTVTVFIKVSDKGIEKIANEGMQTGAAEALRFASDLGYNGVVSFRPRGERSGTAAHVATGLTEDGKLRIKSFDPASFVAAYNVSAANGDKIARVLLNTAKERLGFKGKAI